MNLLRQPIWVRLLVVVIVLAVAYWSRRLPENESRDPPSVGNPAPPIHAERPPADERQDNTTVASESGQKLNPPSRAERPGSAERIPDVDRFVVENVVVKDEQGRVVYRGPVDLTNTIKRIQSGGRLDFRNDGAVFENRERRLPREPRGYYHEFVHPTPKLSGPGPQRVVTGDSGEIYYTFDHYRSFRQLKPPATNSTR